MIPRYDQRLNKRYVTARATAEIWVGVKALYYVMIMRLDDQFG